jgi:BMFP domain-containing protein YqiC
LQLEETVAKMAKRIAQLESRLNQNSQNSSKPPSSD